MLQQLCANGLAPQSCRRLPACHRPQQMHARVALSSVARAGSCTAEAACDALEAIRPCIDLTSTGGNRWRRRDLIDPVLVYLLYGCICFSSCVRTAWRRGAADACLRAADHSRCTLQSISDLYLAAGRRRARSSGPTRTGWCQGGEGWGGEGAGKGLGGEGAEGRSGEWGCEPAACAESAVHHPPRPRPRP
jgi:hypothetical protein